MAEYLPEYVREMGFTHVEFTPIMEHPFYGHGGIRLQVFCPYEPVRKTSGLYVPYRLSSSVWHRVILDWVPSNFPDDLHGLVFFDGTHLYEHADP